MTGITLSLIHLVVTTARVFDLEPSLVMGVIEVESGFDPYALGDKDPQGVPHSFGYMQLHDRGAGAGLPKSVLLDPKANVWLGCRYLSYLFKAFGGDDHLAVSAYNQGLAGAKERGWEYNRTYVEKVLKAKDKYVFLDEILPITLPGG